MKRPGKAARLLREAKESEDEEEKGRLGKEARSYIMSRIRGKDTSPELLVRSWVREAGYRYRLNDRRFPGSPDIYVPRLRLAIFVNGCFWHLHGCASTKVPAGASSYWLMKLERNKERDAWNYKRLEDMEVHVLVVWECEIRTKSQREKARDSFLQGLRRMDTLASRKQNDVI